MTETPNAPLPNKGKSAGQIIRLVLSIFFAIAAIAGIGGFAYNKLTEADRDKDGNVTSQGKVNVTDLKTGDCVVENLAEGQFTRVKVAPCTKGHFFETFATFNLDKGDFPGDKKVDELSGQGCYDRFEAFVGVNYDDSELEMTYMSPVDSTWDINRGVACLLTEKTETKGSLKGAKR